MCVRSIKHSCCNHKARPKRGENGNPCLEAAILPCTDLFGATDKKMRLHSLLMA